MGGNKQIINDPNLELFMVKVLSRVASVLRAPVSLSGEDFYRFADQRPSAYFYIGAAVEGSLDPVTGEPQYPHHSP